MSNTPDSKQDEALKPCPFCGCASIFFGVDNETQKWTISCEGCPISVAAFDRFRVIATWNTRPRASVAAVQEDVDSILQRLVETPAGERIRMQCGAADLRSVITDILAAVSSSAPAEPPQHDSCSHWREGDSDNCVWCGDDLGPTTEADVAAEPLQPTGEQEKL